MAALPAGADGPGPAFLGDSYSFSFSAEPGDYLSFAMMCAQSNHLFVRPGENGIAFFDDMGYPLEYEITCFIDSWDVGADQAPWQAGPNTGADDMGVVQLLAGGDMHRYPPIAATMRVSSSVAAAG